MSITRINEFQAEEGKGAALLEVLGSIVPLVEAAEGCLSCRLLRGVEDEGRFVLHEVWERVEHHQQAVEEIPTDLIQRAMQLLAGAPKGTYYRDAGG